ncbi:alkaline phosphatase [Alteribacter keqinensis]|uniref:Alkaline phosphatase n=1 Tax=Alteribacter keqinensis TaxID=2483800 RepID=A0A3M7TMD3_9BACI|nr:alkaline phosphatase [Alteribacter keqinensis]RNA66622.1 alkaline phosphatase [Alteribacter keqinensis]
MFKKTVLGVLSAAVVVSGLGLGNVWAEASPPGHGGKPDQPGPPPHAGPKPGKEQVDNVIYMIPDGFSAGYNVNYRHYKEDDVPVWDSFLTGMMMTHSNDNPITDSAAAGTAMSTGIKTNNGMLGLDPDGNELETILEAAHKEGKSTGLVATSTITHATPAAFASHVSSRNNQEEIARQYIEEGTVDVLFGGGMDFFLPETEGGRQPERNLIEEALLEGYQVVQDRHGLLELEEGRVLGLFADNAMAPELHRGETEEPSLGEMTSTAIDLLSQEEDGFFLMVEGSQIDWAGHDNDAAWAMSDTEAFEDAVSAAIDFAKEDENTLVIVAGDHDTGGMTLGGYNSKGTDVGLLRDVTATGAYMAGQLNADRSNVREVVEAYTSIKLTDSEVERVREARTPRITINQIVSDYAGVGWSTTGHTGIEVPIFAYGAGSELLTGMVDNTDVPKAIAEAYGITLGNE